MFLIVENVQKFVIVCCLRFQICAWVSQIVHNFKMFMISRNWERYCISVMQRNVIMTIWNYEFFSPWFSRFFSFFLPIAVMGQPMCGSWRPLFSISFFYFYFVFSLKINFGLMAPPIFYFFLLFYFCFGFLSQN